jgi:hypothetical protein
MTSDRCSNKLSSIDAFLYGLPAGFLLAGLLLLCFTSFGKLIIARKARNVEQSGSSHTRVTKEIEGKKRKKKGPPPSSQLKPVDVLQIVSQDSAPEDIRETLVRTGKILSTHTEPGEFFQVSKILEDTRKPGK